MENISLFDNIVESTCNEETTTHTTPKSCTSGRKVRDRWEDAPYDMEDFLTAIDEVADASCWDREPARSLKVINIDDAEDLTEEIISDTRAHSCLAIRSEIGDRALRSSAKTGLDNVLSTALSQLRMSNETDRLLYCKVANLLLGSMRKRSVSVLDRHDKITAIQSERYADICPQQFVNETVDLLKLAFGTVEYISGGVSQELTSATFKLPDAAKTIELNGTPVAAVPMVQIYTADVGTAAATIRPLVKLNGDRPISFTAPFRLIHKGDNKTNWAKKVQDLDKSLLAGFQKAIERLDWLIQSELRYPIPALLRAAKKVHVPAQVYRQCSEELEYEIAVKGSVEDITAYDLIAKIGKKWDESLGTSASTKQKLIVDDAIGKLAMLNWDELDLPAGIEE